MISLHDAADLPEEETGIVYTWDLDKANLQRLQEARMLVEEDDDGNRSFRCKVACRVNEIKKVVFFETRTADGAEVD